VRRIYPLKSTTQTTQTTLIPSPYFHITTTLTITLQHYNTTTLQHYNTTYTMICIRVVCHGVTLLKPLISTQTHSNPPLLSFPLISYSLSWSDFCLWESGRQQTLSQIETEFADFVEDQVAYVCVCVYIMGIKPTIYVYVCVFNPLSLCGVYLTRYCYVTSWRTRYVCITIIDTIIHHILTNYTNDAYTPIL
jgi:hypothetical protein